MPRLSPEQMAAIAAVEWLLTPSPPAARAEGRTTALAIAIIRLAAAHPGRVIPVRDHHPRSESLPLTVQGFVEADPILRSACRWQGLWRTRAAPELAFDLTTSIRNWLPRDWEMPERRPAFIRETPPALSLNPRWGNLNRHVMADDDQVEALIYGLDAARTAQQASDGSRRVRGRRDVSAPKPRTLWDHLEEDES